MSWIDAKVWVGKECEGKERRERLFVDGADYDEIVEAIRENETISAIYFAHEKNWDAIRKLLNKVRIIVEVDSIEEVPEDLKGRIDIILRVPNFITAVKTIRGNRVYVLDLEDATVNIWNGRKVYDQDEVIE